MIIYNKLPLKFIIYRGWPMAKSELDTYILGINSVYHESSACIIKNGETIAAVEEERFNRVKHGKKSLIYNPHILPVNAINFCFDFAGITWEDISHIGFSFDPKTRFEKNTAHKHPYKISEIDFGSFEGETLFYKCMMDIPKRISRLAGYDVSEKFHFIPHHVCHASSSYFVSPFSKAIVLAIDGIGEFASTWMGYGEDNLVEMIKEIDYPNSLGFLWEKFSKYLGFSEYDACKVMGLATSGDMYIPKYIKENFEEIVKLLPDGEFEIDDNIMRFRCEDYKPLQKRFFKDRRDKALDPTATIQEMMIARALQFRTEDVIFHMIDYLVKKVKCDNICLSGGVALNSVVNAKIKQKFPSLNLFVQPAAHDAGTAVGACYYIWNHLLGNPKLSSQSWEHAYWGPSFNDEDIEKILKQMNFSYEKIDYEEELVLRTATMLREKKIVGWFQDRLEFGPRALGHRSLMANPSDGRIKEKINAMGIKNREEFRPFAPSILEEEAPNWLEFEGQSRYMLMIFKIKPEKLGLIDAVTHADHTARPQTVAKEQNPLYYKLIKKFYELTNIPLILNTSFNSQEPIVMSPENALTTFKRTGFDALVIGNYIVTR